MIQPLQVGWYNTVTPASVHLPDFDDPTSLALVIGNTRSIWEHFLNALESSSNLQASDNPLDSFTEEQIKSACTTLSRPYEARFSHDTGPRQVAMQQLAHHSGLAYLAPSHLNVHPVYGPWISLRAVVVINTAGPAGPARPAINPCPDCDNHCAQKFHETIRQLGNPSNEDGIANHWQHWVAIRDACPIGRQWRYGEEQIRYHYTKDTTALMRKPGAC